MPLFAIILSLFLSGCMDDSQGVKTTVPIPSGDAATLSASKNGFHEQEFAANPALKVQMGQVVFTSLEPASATSAQGADTGVRGIDAFPVQIKEAGTYTFNLQIDPRHFLRLVDAGNKEIAKMTGTGITPVTLSPGDYLLELHSGAVSGEQPDPIFIQLGTNQKAEVQASQLVRKTNAVAVKQSASGDPQSNLNVLLTSRSCPGCNLQGIVVPGSNCSNSDYSPGCAGTWDYYDLSGADLSGVNLGSMALVGTNFSGANLQNANLGNTAIGGVNFNSANLTGANLNFAFGNYVNISAVNANFTGANLTDATLVINMTGANLQNAKLGCESGSDADLSGNPMCGYYHGSFAGANLNGASLTVFQWSLPQYVFSGADFSGAIWTDGAFCLQGSTGACSKFTVNSCAIGTPIKTSTCVSDGTLVSTAKPSPYSGAKLDKAVLSNAFLAGNDMSGISLRGTDLSNALLGCPYNNDPVFANIQNVTGNFAFAPPGCAWSSTAKTTSITNLSNADLTGANLSGTNLNMVSLTGAILQGANLSNAYLTNNQQNDPTQTYVKAAGPMSLVGLNMSNANLQGSNLSGDDLSNANLSGANLSGANLNGAKLTGANLSGATWVDGRTCGPPASTGTCN